ncbi:hypothetical protein L6164_028635 [Bauhinia variegata]|uniref:Uncharacterized protein n=1 Tax=Bauhinia variegata TaxID=167791 RepID=A0ACB9L6B6_BAUVA|nr:hypothetical protein L6164_028635 [Bauhinia variegata]
MKLLLFLLSLLVGFHLCSCDSDEISNELKAPPHPPPPPPTITPCPPSSKRPEFHHFLLALTWPNAFCKLPGGTCKPSPPKQDFTIHGLWPQDQSGFGVFDCQETAPLTYDILEQRRQKLLDFWPRLYSASKFEWSKDLWRDQWCKHGTCSSEMFSPDKYIDKAITLGSTYGPRIKNKLEAADIKPNGKAYSWKKMVEAIKEATDNRNVRLICEKDTSGKLLLSEIQICFESDAETLKDCARPTPVDCQKNLVFASATPSPPPPPRKSLDTQIFVSSILEVEEAAGFY